MTTYALIDCDSFFCNCERVFREELRTRPVIVLSNNDGCVVSRSREAKSLGIGMGVPYFQIKEFCHKNKVHAFSSNFSLYTDLSRRVMNTLKSLCPTVEVYSVDEAFVDLSGIANPHQYAQMLRELLWRNVRIPVSIGIAPTKGLCKAACAVAKRDLHQQGVVSLMNHHDQTQALKIIPVEKLWGIASGRAEKLYALKIKSALDFRDYKNDKLIAKVLTKVGRQIQDELRGIICFPLGIPPEKKKEIMSSRTFGNVVYEKKHLMESIASHASEVAEELRMQQSVASELLIFVRSNPFKEGIMQYGASKIHTFLSPTSNTFRLIKAGLNLLDEIYRPNIEYRKAGVLVMGLQDKSEHDLSLFEVGDSERDDALMSTMDKVNKREGAGALQSLACGLDDIAWKMNRNFKSPRYTTNWDEIARV